MIVRFRFDDEAKAAQRAAAKRAAAMVTEISKETERALRAAITRLIREQVPPRDMAATIRGLIGLTSAQAQAVLNFRDELVKNGLSPSKVDTEAERYAERLLDQRADAIARTETMEALNGGQDDAWQQAQDEGVLSEGATKEVIVTPDELLCPICEPLDGQTASISENFSVDGPPFHTHCRCTVGIRKP